MDKCSVFDNKRINRFVFGLVFILFFCTGCASYEHYFEPHTNDGKVLKAYCRGGFGPSNLVTFKVTYHDLLLSVERGNKNTSDYLNYSIPSSIVLLDILFWLNSGETVSIDPSDAFAFDDQRRPLTIVRPSFLTETYFDPVAPAVTGKIKVHVVRTINGKISFEAPIDYNRTSVDIDIQINLGSSKEFTVQLPAFTVSGFEYHFSEINFQEKEGLFFVPTFNC